MCAYIKIYTYILSVYVKVFSATHSGPQNEAKKDGEPKPKQTGSPKSNPSVNNGGIVNSEDEAAESPAPRRKKISVGIPIHPPTGEITDMHIVNKRVAEVKGSYIMCLA